MFMHQISPPLLPGDFKKASLQGINCLIKNKKRLAQNFHFKSAALYVQVIHPNISFQSRP
jgi:hypothetical protein